ncbi:unnamed protein product [Thelazia callipaeda]|uniref:DUF4708 domain-containing protein n=1 Tax=Thelazia callipaeda TaxID=103827 RepID=A0A0N5DCI3_THECL|nr:unnamed protein product [Thelazia callipaeda]
MLSSNSLKNVAFTLKDGCVMHIKAEFVTIFEVFQREVKPPANFLEEVRALERCHKKQEPAFDEHNLLYRNKRLLIRFKAICSIPSSYLLGMRGCPSRTVIYCLAERENPYCTSSDCRKLNLTQVSGVSSEGGVVTEVVKYGALKKGGDSKESMEKSDEFYASEGIAYEEDFAYYSDETDLAVSNQISLLCFLTTVMMI